MNKFSTAITCSLALFLSSHAYSSTDSYNLKEKVELNFSLSDKQKTSDDEEYQKVIFNSIAHGEGFCRDSFGRAFVRKFFASSKKSILTITINKIPYASYTYDQKDKTCSKTYTLESVFSELELARSAQRKFVVTLIYSDEAEIKALEELSSIGKAVSTLGPDPILSGAASALVDILAKKFDQAIAASISSNDLHQVEFRLPDELSNTQIQLNAKIADKNYDLLKLVVVKQSTRLQGRTPSSVMTTTRKTDGTSAQKVVESYRSGSGATVNDMFRRLTVECNELRSNFSSTLNEKDMRFLLESHLLHNYPAGQTKLHLQNCFGNTDETKIVIFELKENIIADIDIVTPRNLRRDPVFLSNLNQLGYTKIITPSTKYFDKNELLPAKSVDELVALPNIIGPFCYQFLEENIVNFVMFNRRTGKPLFFEANIDREYSTTEYKSGMLSTINALSVNDLGRYEYNTATGIQACIASRMSNSGISVASTGI